MHQFYRFGGGKWSPISNEEVHAGDRLISVDCGESGLSITAFVIGFVEDTRFGSPSGKDLVAYDSYDMTPRLWGTGKNPKDPALADLPITCGSIDQQALRTRAGEFGYSSGSPVLDGCHPPKLNDGRNRVLSVAEAAKLEEVLKSHPVDTSRFPKDTVARVGVPVQSGE